LFFFVLVFLFVLFDFCVSFLVFRVFYFRLIILFGGGGGFFFGSGYSSFCWVVFNLVFLVGRSLVFLGFLLSFFFSGDILFFFCSFLFWSGLGGHFCFLFYMCCFFFSFYNFLPYFFRFLSRFKTTQAVGTSGARVCSQLSAILSLDLTRLPSAGADPCWGKVSRAEAAFGVLVMIMLSLLRFATAVA